MKRAVEVPLAGIRQLTNGEFHAASPNDQGYKY